MQSPFAFYMKENDKEDWLVTIRKSLEHFLTKHNYLPNKIYMNPNEIKVLRGAKGVNYKGKDILVLSQKTCILKHIQLEL